MTRCLLKLGTLLTSVPVQVTSFLVLLLVGLKQWLHPAYTIVCGALLAGLSFWAQSRQRDPDRHTARKHAVAGVLQTLVSTWSLSGAIALGIISWAHGDVPSETEKKVGFVAMLMLVAQNVGGVLALMRSVRTRSETGATLKELSSIRVAALSSPVIEEAIRVFEVQTPVELIAVVARMLRLVVSLPLARALCDKASLWVRDDRQGVWFLLCSSEFPPGGHPTFTMPILEKVTEGAGIVPNLAIVEPPKLPGCRFEADVFVCSSALQSHPWFLPNSLTSSGGMVATLLRSGGEVVGVLSLTTLDGVTLPTQGTKSDELIDIMRFWAHSFAVAVTHLRGFAKEAGDA